MLPIAKVVVGMLLSGSVIGAAPESTTDASMVVHPPNVSLNGTFETTQLVVRPAVSKESEDRQGDLTPTAKFESADPAVASVSSTGRVESRGNGATTVAVTVGDAQVIVPVEVTNFDVKTAPEFATRVLPVLSKSGCNMGACHAAQYGKGGFKLTVFGFDPRQDHRAIVRGHQQRRVNLVTPEESLLLLKPTMVVPHGGSRRLRHGDLGFRVLSAWLQAGAPAPQSSPPRVVGLTVYPKRRVVDVGDSQQLRVEAEYADGRRRDVTAWAKFDAGDEALLSVDKNGLVEVLERGQAPVMARFEGQAEICMFVAPYSDTVQLANWKSENFVDELAVAKFRELGLAPSELCDDATFLRRAFLDAIGELPTVEEATRFLESDRPDKRRHLVDRLLGRTGDSAEDIYNDQYASYWTLRWSDLIRNTSVKLGEQGMWALHNWIRERFRTNAGFDTFVSELVTAKGSIYRNGPANYFRINANATDLTESTAQLFLGVRLECAKCHHHPFEAYSQADYYRFSAFFSRVGSKNSQEFGLFGRESVILVKASGEVRHPRTGKVLKPQPLGGEPMDDPLDRRLPLASWLTSPENPFFARSVVNRYVRFLLGRGLVEPVDDMRSTNPPSNVALMDALSKEFVDSGFDLKHLMRTIMVSRLYQLSSQPTAANRADRRFFSHFQVKRLPAEPLLDAIDRVTAVRTKFKSLPLGTRAVALPDAEYPNEFLNTFAKPRRASVCDCERAPDANLAQALHTLNGEFLSAKITNKNGRLANLMAAKADHNTIVRELYLAALSRLPTEAEKKLTAELSADSDSPQEFYEDLMWSLLNSKQFLFVH